MARKDYYENVEKKKPTWHENYSTKLEEHLAILGITPEQLAQAQADSVTVRTEIDETEQAKQAYFARVSRKNTTLSTIEARTRAVANFIKASPGYTEAIGIDLGIVGEEAGLPTSLENVKPEVTITLMPGRVRNDWKKGKFHALAVYRMRGAETEWKKIETDLKSPFDDEDPNLVPGVPELRKYKYVYILDDIEVGIALELSVVVLQ
ncbi:MAG: hypothetical protein HY960_01815 [Ignavibacteriae bacterium]|nr:hypothetical protein [Ignavibacteriota bacterium]